MAEYLKVVWAELSTLSQAILLHCKESAHGMSTATSSYKFDPDLGVGENQPI
jgi:hypothetical protein